MFKNKKGELKGRVFEAVVQTWLTNQSKFLDYLFYLFLHNLAEREVLNYSTDTVILLYISSNTTLDS